MDARGGGDEWLEATDPHPLLARGERRQILYRLRRATTYGRGFPRPLELASELAVDVEPVAELPGGCSSLTDGRRILYVANLSQRVSGTRVFLGLAGALLGIEEIPHTRGDVWFLAGRLAAPPMLVRQIGIDSAIAQQSWATEAFLRRWWSEVRRIC